MLAQALHVVVLPEAPAYFAVTLEPAEAVLPGASPSATAVTPGAVAGIVGAANVCARLCGQPLQRRGGILVPLLQAAAAALPVFAQGVATGYVCGDGELLECTTAASNLADAALGTYVEVT